MKSQLVFVENHRADAGNKRDKGRQVKVEGNVQNPLHTVKLIHNLLSVCEVFLYARQGLQEFHIHQFFNVKFNHLLPSSFARLFDGICHLVDVS